MGDRLCAAAARTRLAGDFAPAVDTLKGRAEALYVCSDPLLTTNRLAINTLAIGARLPTMHGFREFVEAGGLMSYGPNFPDLFRRAAEYVDKILRGAKPADLPVIQPTKFELVINLKATKTLGLGNPPVTARPRRRGDRIVRHQRSLDRTGGLNKGEFLAHRNVHRSEDETATRPLKEPAEKVVQDIRRATRKHYSAEEKIRIVLEGLRGEDSIAELCRREGIAQNLYYRWSKDWRLARSAWLAIRLGPPPRPGASHDPPRRSNCEAGRPRL